MTATIAYVDRRDPLSRADDLLNELRVHHIPVLATAAARARGMTPAQHAELLAIVSLAAKTNHLATGLQVPVDPVFDAGASH